MHIIYQMYRTVTLLVRVLNRNYAGTESIPL